MADQKTVERRKKRETKEHREKAQALVSMLGHLKVLYAHVHEMQNAESALGLLHTSEQLRHDDSFEALIEADAEQLYASLDYHRSLIVEFPGESVENLGIACLACGSPPQTNPPGDCPLGKRCRSKR